MVPTLWRQPRSAGGLRSRDGNREQRWRKMGSAVGSVSTGSLINVVSISCGRHYNEREGLQLGVLSFPYLVNRWPRRSNTHCYSYQEPHDQRGNKQAVVLPNRLSPRRWWANSFRMY